MYFYTTPFENLRGNVVRMFLSGSLISTGPCSVPTMFLQLFANRRVTNGRAPPFPMQLGVIYYAD